MVEIELTEACNLKCIHCYAEAGEKLPKELPTEEIINLIDKIAKNGSSYILLTGGEPLLHKDFFKIMKYADSKKRHRKRYGDGLPYPHERPGLSYKAGRYRHSGGRPA